MQISIFLEHILQAHEQSGKSLEEVLAYTKKCGIKGLETNAGFIASQPELQNMIFKTNLTFTQLYENYGWEDFDSDLKMKNQLKTAKKLGASKILFIPPYFSDFSEETIRSEKEKVKIMIKKLCSLAQTENITVTMEDFDNLQSPSSKICYLKEYLTEIPELKITFDTGNFLANKEDVLEAFPILKNRIVNVHCKDRLPDVSSCITGKGIIPFKTIFENLKLQNYDGNYTIEHFDIKNQLEGIEKSPENILKLLNSDYCSGTTA